jgi:hypothetical protein
MAFVGAENVAGGKLFGQCRASGAVGDMPAAEHDGQRAALSIG